VKLPSGLVAVALNTNFYYLNNKVYANLTEDPGNQFSMLREILTEARENSTKVRANFTNLSFTTFLL